MQIVFPTRGLNARYPKGQIIQGFGENYALYHSLNPNLKGHPGIDIVPVIGYGEDVLAPHDGVIAKLAFIDPALIDDQLTGKNGYGNELAILSPKQPDGHYICSFLCHLTADRLVVEGQAVIAGQVVAKMGNSGFVVSGGVEYWGQANPDKKGTHCHWKTLWLTDPIDGHSNTSFLGKNYLMRDFDNGFDNSFDPLSLFQGDPMNQAKVVKSKKSPAIYICYPMPAMEYLNTKANLEGFAIPNPIPDTDSLA